ncbi:hypothetical protein [Chondrinema litorale]|uniref:hypothetical protein n=1 Tax=Chondrinema litorale TaxID=2994555 RepID=UPI002543CFE1|nr:hypothetical protein [Chondrinema litorale]UZR95471.1 hypothetical protein OQ292_06550 [Chondrinema litorale]
MILVKEYFLAGYKATWSGSYFNAVELLGHYVNFPHPTLLERVTAEMQELKTQTGVAVADVLSVQNTANKARIHMMPPPEFPEAYFSWARMCYSGFDEKLSDLSPEKIAFDIGYYSGEILTSMKVLKVILKISTAVIGVPAFEPQWKNLSKTILKANKQLSAAARLSTMTPNGPVKLHDLLYARLTMAALEIGQADIDFSSDAYLRLLSGKIENYLSDFNESIQTIAAEL